MMTARAATTELATLAEQLLAAARREDWEAVAGALPDLARANAVVLAAGWEGPVAGPGEDLGQLQRDLEALRACALERRAELAEALRALRGRQRALCAYVEHD